MFGFDLIVEPVDVGLSIAPVETDRRPFQRFNFARWINKSMAQRPPAKPKPDIARFRLIRCIAQKLPELLARNIVFSNGKGAHGHIVLRSFIVVAARFACRTAHRELARRNRDHDGAIFRALGKFARGLILSAHRRRGKERRKNKQN